MTMSFNQSRRAAKDRRKETMDERLSGGKVVGSPAVSVAFVSAVAFITCWPFCRKPTMDAWMSWMGSIVVDEVENLSRGMSRL